MSRRRTENSSGIEKNNGDLLAKALEVLRSGEAIVFPTETFYGLGANAFDEKAVEHVAALKGRDPNQPIPLIIADLNMLQEVVTEIPPMAKTLLTRFWPGPLTLVLPAKKGLASLLCNSGGGVGVRISSHPAAIALAKGLGCPITATSANPSGEEPAKTVAQAQNYFLREVQIFLDGGELTARKGSTVVEIHQDGYNVVREGQIESEEIERVLAKKNL